MSTFSQFGGGAIKSMQRGVITLSGGAGTATVTSVDTAKSVLHHLGLSSAASGSGNATLVLTDATTITAAFGATSGTVSWQLVEFY